MAARSGLTGKLVLGTDTVANIGTWTLNSTVPMNETTSFTETWKTQLPGPGEWSIDAEGFYNDDDTNGQVAIQTAYLAKTSVTIKAYVDATNYYSGTAYISKFSPANDAKGVCKISLTFSGTGALAYN